VDRDRAERIALTEAAFRIANERMAAWTEVPADAPALYFCECAVLDCREKLSLTRAQYEGVRSEPSHFAVIPGPEVLDVEDIVDRAEGFVVVEKPDAVMGIVAGTDPRSGDRHGAEGRDEAEAIASEIAPDPPSPPAS
jgi:hypothetical protein